MVFLEVKKSMNPDYELEGQMGGEVGTIIGLIVGIGIAVLVLIFVGVLGGQTYQITESKISSITDANIKADIEDAVESGFEALKTTGDYLPVVVIAFIVIIILGLILGLMAISGGRGGYGGAL